MDSAEDTVEDMDPHFHQDTELDMAALAVDSEVDTEASAEDTEEDTPDLYLLSLSAEVMVQDTEVASEVVSEEAMALDMEVL